MSRIQFFTEGVRNPLRKPGSTTRWIRRVIRLETGGIQQLNYIFCTDPFLKGINHRFLAHRYFTDIITFDYSATRQNLEGDIYISLDRVRENSKHYGVPFQEELHRVLIHGVLHLLGYSDKTKANKALMREKEDAYLSLR
jgi:rRNA maturation RNase YbeY